MAQAMKIAAHRDVGASSRRARTRAYLHRCPADSTLRFRRISGRVGFDRIESLWRHITARWPAVRHYQTYDWYRTYLDVLEYRENAWHFFIVYQGYVPVGIVPVRQIQTLVKGVPLRALELPAHPHAPFADLIIDTLSTGTFSAAFVDYLRNCGLAWDALILRRIRAESPALRLFAPGAMLLHAAASPYSCDMQRADVRRARAPATRPRDIEYVASRDRATLHRFFHAFLQVESAAWQGHPAPHGAICDDGRLVRYYRRLIEAFGDGGCEIGLLTLNGQPIAAQFCLLSPGTRHVLKMSHDPAYARLSPGRLLLDAMREPANDDRICRLIASAPPSETRLRALASFDIYRFNTTKQGLSAHAYMRAGQAFGVPHRHYLRARRAMRRRLHESIVRLSYAMDHYLHCP